MTFSSDVNTSQLSIGTNLSMNLSDKVGIYTLRLKAYQEGFKEFNINERDFLVEIFDPCLTTTLTIDENNMVFA